MTAVYAFEEGWFDETCIFLNGALSMLIDSPAQLVHIAGYTCNLTTHLLTLNASTGELLYSTPLPGQSYITSMHWLSLPTSQSPAVISSAPASRLAVLLDSANTRILTVDLAQGRVVARVE